MRVCQGVYVNFEESASFSHLPFANLKLTRLLAITNCLPLPPPIGCAETYHPHNVIENSETDFAWLCVANSVVSAGTVILTVALLCDDKNSLFGASENTIKKLMTKSFILSGELYKLFDFSLQNKKRLVFSTVFP